MGNSMEGSGLHKKQLREVKEEPIERGSDEIESDYFRKLDVIFQRSNELMANLQCT